MNELSIKLLGLSEQTANAFRSMLTLLEPALGTRWEVRDTLPADVVLLPVDALARIPRKEAHALPLYLALGNDGPCPPNAFSMLTRPVTPPRLIEVLQLAEGLIGRLRESDHGPETVPLLESVHGQARLAPATFDSRIRTTLRAATLRLLQAPVAATVLDDRRQSIFTFIPGVGYATRLTTHELAEEFRLNQPAVLVELSEAEAAALRDARDFWPTRELEWAFWITNRSPWLRPELLPVKHYCLRRWPDFGRLPHYHSDVRMASFLMSQALTLNQLRERAGVKPETAMNFLNAAYTLGILVESAAPGTIRVASPVLLQNLPAPPQPRGWSGLIAQLRRKFGLAGTRHA